MMKLRTLLLGLSVAALLGSQSFGADLKKGDKAPDFELKGTDGKTYKLSDFKDKKAVLIAWYPKALTGG
jgi:peroxiredoxin Q/BCP